MPQLHRCTWNVNLRNPSQQSVELDHFDTIDCLSLCLYGLRRNTALQLKHLDDRESTSHAVVLFERKISPKSPPSWWPCPMATWCTWCPGNCPQMWHYSRQPPSDWNWSSLYCCTSHGIDSYQFLLPYHRSPQSPSSCTWRSCGAPRRPAVPGNWPGCLEKLHTSVFPALTVGCGALWQTPLSR